MATLNINTGEIRLAAKTLRIYDRVLLSGVLYTARDAAHKRLVSLLSENKPLPFSLPGATIYYAGPTTPPPHLPIGACGPTTSSRMDSFSPMLLDNGLACMIGKGERSGAVREAIVRNNALYLCAIGGAGALACECVRTSEVIGFCELGCEAIRRLTVVNFPLIVAVDTCGGDVFSENATR